MCGDNVKVSFCYLGQEYDDVNVETAHVFLLSGGIANNVTSDKIFVLIYVVHVTWAMTHALWLMI